MLWAPADWRVLFCRREGEISELNVKIEDQSSLIESLRKKIRDLEVSRFIPPGGWGVGRVHSIRTLLLCSDSSARQSESSVRQIYPLCALSGMRRKKK